MTREDEHHDLDISIRQIDIKLEYLTKELDEIKLSLNSHFVTQEEFKPIKLLVYGAVGLILTSIIIAAIGVVVT